MERIGQQTIWSFLPGKEHPEATDNLKIRRSTGHRVNSYMDLASKVAELQFRNRDHMLLFRGQATDFRTTQRNTMLKAGLFRLDGARIPGHQAIVRRFNFLKQAERRLVHEYSRREWLGQERLQRHRVLRWAILQHYEVCPTPLLDVTQSLRVAASFASLESKPQKDVFLFVLAVPNLSGAVTASAEAGLQVIRLASACPPVAVRPHLQEGYLLGEYPDVIDYEQKQHYDYHEMDFGRRLVAKFRFQPKDLWQSSDFPAISRDALYSPTDPLLSLTQILKRSLGRQE